MGRSACVVGSAGGIGSALVEHLRKDGWDTILEMDLSAPIPIDLASPDSVKKAFERGREVAPKIDLLVVAAGILDRDRLPDLTIERWQQVLAVNLTGTFACCREADQWVSDGGRIVLVSSLAARTGGSMTGTAYSVSKGGVETLTKSMAHYFAARRITVNCVSPGGVLTQMMAKNPESERKAMELASPLKRMAEPREIAATIVFLASEDAGFMTGAIVPVNGGIRMD